MPSFASSKINQNEDGWLSRERALALALVVTTTVVFYLCYRLILPFLPALAWALALAVMAHPMNRRINQWIPYPTIASALSVLVVVVVIVIPVIFVTQNLVREASRYSQRVQDEYASGKWRQAMEKNPRLKPVLRWIDSEVNGKLGNTVGNGATDNRGEGNEAKRDSDSSSRQNSTKSNHSNSRSSSSRDVHSELAYVAAENQLASQPVAEDRNSRENESKERDKSKDSSTGEKPIVPAGVAQVERAATVITQGVSSVLTSTIWLVMQLFITVLTLFFFFRDRRHALGVLRSLMPLSDKEVDDVFSRVDDTIHATIYGSIVVAMVQGAMGGLMFWMLGLPSPLMWGAVMGLLAVVPVLGTFVVWAPAAIYLAFNGEWFKALALAGWGSCAIGLIDNFLYPFLVGKRLRFHTLVVFFAIVGGLTLFGASGIILGPLIVAIADALLEVWRRRTAFGGTIEAGVEPAS